MKLEQRSVSTQLIRRTDSNRIAERWCDSSKHERWYSGTLSFVRRTLRNRLAIVGCGVMGTRHFAGLAELIKAGLSDFELAAVCDLVPESAEKLAQRAEEELGKHTQTDESE